MGIKTIRERISNAQMLPTVISLLFIIFISNTQKATTKKVK
jgi:hypothetical protein